MALVCSDPPGQQGTYLFPVVLTWSGWSSSVLPVALLVTSMSQTPCPGPITGLGAMVALCFHAFVFASDSVPTLFFLCPHLDKSCDLFFSPI